MPPLAVEDDDGLIITRGWDDVISGEAGNLAYDDEDFHPAGIMSVAIAPSI